MQRFKLSSGGPEVSEIAYGVWRLADDDQGSDPKRVRAKIDHCLSAGITTFDHADIYGMYTCEGLFGKVLADAPELRDQIEIITKCGIRAPCDALPGARVSHYDATVETIERCVDRSLRELSTDRIDLLLIHRPDWLTSAHETAEGLERVIKAGKVLSVGVSNYSVAQFRLLQHALGTSLATNQIEINLLHMDAIYDGTLDQCQENGIHPMAWSPLAGGNLFSDDPAAKRTREALERIGAEYSATADQMAYAWIAALPSRPQIVIGTNKLDRIDAAAASTAIKLDRQHWYELWEAAKGQPIP